MWIQDIVKYSNTMKPEEMAALGQDFRNKVQIVQGAKERKEREVYEFVEELLTLMAHIAEKEGENLKEDNIFTWSKKRELESQESLYLGNFTTNNENNEDQKVSSYVITGQGIEVNFIYNKESDEIERSKVFSFPAFLLRFLCIRA